MGEIIIKSKKYPNLIVQIFNGNEFGMLGENILKKDEELFTDSKDYAFEILRLLKEAEKRGCFDKAIEEDNERAEEILI